MDLKGAPIGETKKDNVVNTLCTINSKDTLAISAYDMWKDENDKISGETYATAQTLHNVTALDSDGDLVDTCQNCIFGLNDATDEISDIAQNLLDSNEGDNGKVVIYINAIGASAPMVTLSLNGCKVNALCDTGASVTAISKEVYEGINEKVRPAITPTPNVSVTAANSQPMTMLGSARFEVELGKYKRSIAVYVSPVLPEPGCMLGRDFLNKSPFAVANDRLVDLKLLSELAGTEAVEKSSTPYLQKAEGKVIPLRVLQPTSIGPQEKLHVSVQLETPTDSKFGIFEGILRDEMKGIIAPPVLQDLTQRPLTLFMYNSSAETYCLTTDSMIGTCDTEIDLHRLPNGFTEEQFINAVKHVPYTPTEEEIDNAIKQCRLDLCDALENEADRQELEQILRRHTKAISTSDIDMGFCELERFRINTLPGAIPPKVVPTKIPMHWQAEVRKIIEGWERAGIIEPSDSPFTARVLVVPKKDGSKRVCVDYRKLNSITITDPFPLPNQEVLRESLYGSKYFIAVDLNMGFMQMALDPETAHKTAFVLNNGHWQFTVMPFGPTNSPSVFTKLMCKVLCGLLGDICLCYIDDILIFGVTVRETLDRFERVLARLEQHNLKLKPKKCVFFRKRIDYLGHELTADGIEPMKFKVDKVRNWPTPQNPRALRGFLGLASYYRSFIQDFGGIAQPLYQIAKLKDNHSPQYVWDGQAQVAFDTLKVKLTQAPCLAFPNYTGLFVLDTDASEFGLGGVLQQYQDEKLRVIAYGSKTITGSWKNYSVTQKEMLAIVFFVRQYRHFLLGRRFVLRTDHAALQWLFTFKEPTGMIARWITTLSSYDMAIIYRKGTDHGNADALSRMPTLENADALMTAGTLVAKKISSDGVMFLQFRMAEPVNDTVGPSSAKKAKLDDELLRNESSASVSANEIVCTVSDSETPTGETCAISGDNEYKLYSIDWPADPIYDWEMQQSQDVVCLTVILILTSGDITLEKFTPQQNAEIQQIIHMKEKFRVEQGLLYYRPSPEKRFLVVPYKVRRCLVEDIHRTTHKGRKPTVELVREKYWWPTLIADVSRIVQTCDICQKCKRLPGAKKAPLQLFPSFKPFASVALDLVGPLNTIRGKTYILTIIDFATRWIEAIPLSNAKAPTVARAFFNEWCCRYGHPTHIHSDQGGQFEGNLFHELCRIMCVKKTKTTAYHPQCNGRCEKANGVFIQAITALTQEFPNDWDRVLPFALSAIRKSINATTGYSPAQLVLGRNLPASFLVSDPPPQIVMKAACDWIAHLEEALAKMNADAERNMLHKSALYKRQYDKHTTQRTFVVGDMVYIRYHVPPPECPEHYKFFPRYHGPYKIIEKFSDLVFRVQARDNEKDVRTLNISDFKPYFPSDPREGDELPNRDMTPIKRARLTEEETTAPAGEIGNEEELEDEPMPLRSARPNRGKRKVNDDFEYREDEMHLIHATQATDAAFYME